MNKKISIGIGVLLVAILCFFVQPFIDHSIEARPGGTERQERVHSPLIANQLGLDGASPSGSLDPGGSESKWSYDTFADDRFYVLTPAILDRGADGFHLNGRISEGLAITEAEEENICANVRLELNRINSGDVIIVENGGPRSSESGSTISIDSCKSSETLYRYE